MSSIAARAVSLHGSYSDPCERWLRLAGVLYGYGIDPSVPLSAKGGGRRKRLFSCLGKKRGGDFFPSKKKWENDGRTLFLFLSS